MADASCMWNGYLYQGKIALLYMIITINRLFKENNQDKINLHEIIIEGNEDFDVKFDGHLIEFHQVKAYNCDKKVDDFIKPIIKLNKNKKLHNASEIYIHTCNRIDNWTLNDFNNNTVNEKEKLENKIALKTITPKENQYLTDLREVTDDYFRDLKLYSYNGNSYISLLEIDDVIVDEIKKYFLISSTLDKVDEAKKYYFFLQDFLQKEVNIRHINFNITCKGINLFDFNEKLDSNEPLTHSENYYLYHMKQKFIDAIYINYCINSCKRNEENECEQCRAMELANLVAPLDLNEFKIFYYIINPAIPSEITNDNILNSFDYKEIVYYSRLVNEILTSKIEIINHNYYFKNNKVYYPTAIINEDENKNGIKSICLTIVKNIRDNNSFIEQAFQADKLITRHLKVDNIFETFADVDDVNKKKIQINNLSIAKKNDITKNNVALINEIEAKEELNHA